MCLTPIARMTAWLSNNNLLPAEDHVHAPATSDMLAGLAAMVQDVGIGAAESFKGIGKKAETGRVKRSPR